MLRDTICRMPEISRFLGIVVVHGRFPRRALRHVLDWAALHRGELLANWELARQGEPLNRIPPLE